MPVVPVVPVVVPLAVEPVVVEPVVVYRSKSLTDFFNV
jgi:hypothetical protein